MNRQWLKPPPHVALKLAGSRPLIQGKDGEKEPVAVSLLCRSDSSVPVTVGPLSISAHIHGLEVKGLGAGWLCG